LVVRTSPENYLKGILSLQGDGNESVNTNALAEKVGTAAASVTDMLGKLKAMGLVHYEKYKGVRLTSEGYAKAMEIVRKHRLWECFLADSLKFEWHRVHDVAEQLEHIDSPDLIERLDEFLGFPSLDPHGDPIPDANGEYRFREETVALSKLNKGESGILKTVADSSGPFLIYLDTKNIRPGSEMEVVEKFDFDGSMDVKINEMTANLSSKVAESLLVKRK
jgi:DtxR family transcriptional regulator, Mn-dependent transcriptional regulator